MTEEKKDDLNEQQTFLSGHEELLKSIQPKTETPDEQPEQVEAPPAEVEIEEKETPTIEAAPVVEEEKEAAPAAEPEPVVETPKEQPQPKTEKPVPAPALNKLNGKKKKKKAHQQPQHSTQHEEVLKKQALEQQEVKEVLVFFRKYAKSALIVVVVICALVLANRFFKSQRQSKELRADTALMNARSADDLQAILDDYASTPAAPVALMGLAREKFNAGQIDEAEALYTQFIKKHGDQEQVSLAKLNLIACKESKSQFGEAHLLYGEFVKEHKGSYLVPSARMGQARCLEALGELGEAQIAYEDIIVNHPESSWSRMAEANLKILLGKKQ